MRRLRAILASGDALLTHNYVLVESTALVQARLGLAAAVKLARDSAALARFQREGRPARRSPADDRD